MISHFPPPNPAPPPTVPPFSPQPPSPTPRSPPTHTDGRHHHTPPPPPSGDRSVPHCHTRMPSQCSKAGPPALNSRIRTPPPCTSSQSRRIRPVASRTIGRRSVPRRGDIAHSGCSSVRRPACCILDGCASAGSRPAGHLIHLCSRPARFSWCGWCWAELPGELSCHGVDAAVLLRPQVACRPLCWLAIHKPVKPFALLCEGLLSVMCSI